MIALVLFGMLLAGHALADGPMQIGWATLKRRHLNRWWAPTLLAHAGVHALFVAAITGSLILGVLEWGAHTLIDLAKCEGRIGTWLDQSLHVACKALWVGLLFGGLT